VIDRLDRNDGHAVAAFSANAATEMVRPGQRFRGIWPFIAHPAGDGPPPDCAKSIFACNSGVILATPLHFG